MQYLHIDISVTVSDSPNTWSDPQGRHSMNFSLPEALLESKKVAELLDGMVKTAKERLEEEKAKAIVED